MTQEHTAARPVVRGDPTLGFVGVTASRSSINDVFPLWSEELGLDGARLEPWDIPQDADDRMYRRVLEDLRGDPRFLGALVTSHKLRLIEAAGDLIDEYDEHARRLGEVSCLSKRDERVRAHAKDPITAGRALWGFVAPDHFADTGAEVLCLGAGGSGLALTIHLLAMVEPSRRPSRITLVDRDASRLEEAERLHRDLGDAGVAIECVTNAVPEESDRLVAGLPEASLVVNATGLGKDAPGSPLTDDALFPHRARVWDFNYRGDLRFLAQARAQERARELVVEDGWDYFVHGWSEVVSEVFGIPLDDALVRRLGGLAAAARS
ncbi:shikimate dehydrogenase [Egibacter rhizosphaerae]|uniref:Shikimate dehydrogenase n=1 Tax=Egibacter rhizosphaerae TaxID=1670831 RepID=A0A411YHD6_9ACTN|nr:shikimate dehydrogenase [Egibacter rhizosphaerae]QBI20650.1 shikimate dehydrogenase [Egibacter rhizosphaerae]